MSDEQTDAQGATPEDEQPTGDAQPSPEQPDPAQDAGAPADAEASASASDALDAAQAAVSAAQTGDLESSDAAEAAVESARDVLDEVTGEAASAVGDAEGPASFAVPSFTPSAPAADTAEMQLLGDVNVDVRIELGRTRMLVEDVLKLGEGAVVELEKLAGDPVDVYVNGRHVARGEVLVLNESFCVRVNEVLEAVTIDQGRD